MLNVEQLQFIDIDILINVLQLIILVEIKIIMTVSDALQHFETG